MNKRMLLKKLFFYFLMFVLVITLTELLVRAFDPIGIDYFSEAGRYFSNMMDNDSYAYIHRPNYQDKLQGVDVSINSHGLRGSEFHATKQKGKVRLMVLGDSVVFGWGAPQGSIFPVQLQNLLNKKAAEIEVIAAGVGSWNTRTEYEYLRTNGIHFGPDVILLLIVNNDIEPKRHGYKEIINNKTLKKKNILTRIFNHLRSESVKYSYLLSYIRYYQKSTAAGRSFSEDSPEWKDAKLALEGIINLCRNHDVALVVFFYATSEDLENNMNLIMYKNLLDTAAIPVFTFPTLLFESAYRNSIVDPHANTLGHRIIAQEMYKVLKPVIHEKISVLNMKTPP